MDAPALSETRSGPRGTDRLAGTRVCVCVRVRASVRVRPLSKAMSQYGGLTAAQAQMLYYQQAHGMGAAGISQPDYGNAQQLGYHPQYVAASAGSAGTLSTREPRVA